MTNTNQIVAGAGGGGGCFRKGAQIQLEHGKTVAIEALKEGDEVLAFDEHDQVHVAKVTKLHYHPECQPILRVKFWRGETYITPNHWVLNQYGNFAEMGSLTSHDALVDGMGHLRPIISAELVGYEPVYNLTVEPHHTFIADGVRVHNGGHRERYPVVAGAGGGGGSKGGGGGAIEDPDSLQSRAVISILDLLGEGQIGGLVNGANSILFNDTPIQNTDGTYNFTSVATDGSGNLVPVAFGYQFRDGTQSQDPISGFSDVESPTYVGVLVQHDIPAVVTLADPNIDSVRLVVAVPSLMSQDTTTGDTHGSSVSFQFDISVNNDPYTSLSGPLTISGKTRSRYQRAYLYALPKFSANGSVASQWSIRMTRTTADSTTSNVQNQVYFDSYVEIIDSKLSYPNSAMIGITIDSGLFNSIPSRSYLIHGLYIQVPSNYDPVTRVYTGVWDGTFKLAVSGNPAWVLYDLLTNTRYGLGQYILPSQVDKAALYQIGKYCDELVSDGFGGTEPRFVINTVIQNQSEAYKLISDISSAFRGMTYWNGGMAGFTQDAPTDPSMLYNAANVIDGMFTYSGSARKDRHSAVLVTWNNPADNYKQAIEYVEDATLVAKFGLRKLDTVAFGCTSRGQAHRVGRWILYTEAYESDMITFKVGMDSALVTPGEVVQIHDATRAGKRLGGRLKATTPTSATLDASVTLDSAATISIRMPDGTFQDRTLLEAVGGTYDTVTWTSPLPDVPVANAIWLISETNLVPLLARVVGISQDATPGVFTITAIEHNPSKYDAIDNNLTLEIPKTSLIDINDIATPTDANVLEAPYQVAPGVLGLNLIASWSGQGSYYEVTWKRTGEYPTNPETITLTNPLLELDNVRAGDYTYSVVAVNTFGKRSQALVFTHTTLGKTSAPGDVANFQITKRTNDLLLTWDAVTDIDLLGYEVRVGASWDSGAVIITNFAGTMITHDQSAAGNYYYHIRSINMSGAYSDNVTTVLLALIAPKTPANFTIIQSGTRLELSWSPNTETDLAFYEVREGVSWSTGTLVSQTMATSLSVPSGNIGTRQFWIEAVASPGIYSDTPAWITTNIALPTNSNIVAKFDEAALGWPGNKINMALSGSDLMMVDNVPQAEYIFDVNLLDTYRAQNSLYATLNSVLQSTSSITWDTSSFSWDSNDALQHWAPSGNISSVTARYQIARAVGLNASEVDAFSLNGTSTSVAGKTAATELNATYQSGRYAQGLHVTDGVQVGWNTLSIPDAFLYSLWMMPKTVGNSAEYVILHLSGANGFLELRYNEAAQEFRLVDSVGNVMALAAPIAVGDVIGASIVQTATTRKLFIGKMGSAAALSTESAFLPIGTFDTVNLFQT